LQQAAQKEFPPEMRLEALVNLAKRFFEANQNQNALFACQAILDEESFAKRNDLIKPALAHKRKRNCLSTHCVFYK